LQSRKQKYKNGNIHRKLRVPTSVIAQQPQQRNQFGRTNLLNVSLPSYFELILQRSRPFHNSRVTHILFTDRYIDTTFFKSSLAGCVNPDFLVESVEFWSEPINWMLRSPLVRRAEGTPESDEYSSAVLSVRLSTPSRHPKFSGFDVGKGRI
jgi:hypothetical protein